MKRYLLMPLNEGYEKENADAIINGIRMDPFSMEIYPDLNTVMDDAKFLSKDKNRSYAVYEIYPKLNKIVNYNHNVFDLHLAMAHGIKNDCLILPYPKCDAPGEQNRSGQKSFLYTYKIPCEGSEPKIRAKKYDYGGFENSYVTNGVIGINYNWYDEKSTALIKKDVKHKKKLLADIFKQLNKEQKDLDKETEQRFVKFQNSSLP